MKKDRTWNIVREFRAHEYNLNIKNRDLLIKIGLYTHIMTPLFKQDHNIKLNKFSKNVHKCKERFKLTINL